MSHNRWATPEEWVVKQEDENRLTRYRVDRLEAQMEAMMKELFNMKDALASVQIRLREHENAQ